VIEPEVDVSDIAREVLT